MTWSELLSISWFTVTDFTIQSKMFKLTYSALKDFSQQIGQSETKVQPSLLKLFSYCLLLFSHSGYGI